MHRQRTSAEPVQLDRQKRYPGFMTVEEREAYENPMSRRAQEMYDDKKRSEEQEAELRRSMRDAGFRL